MLIKSGRTKKRKEKKDTACLQTLLSPGKKKVILLGSLRKKSVNHFCLANYSFENRKRVNKSPTWTTIRFTKYFLVGRVQKFEKWNVLPSIKVRQLKTLAKFAYFFDKLPVFILNKSHVSSTRSSKRLLEKYNKFRYPSHISKRVMKNSLNTKKQKVVG